MKVMTIDTLSGLSGPGAPAQDPFLAFQVAGDELDAILVRLMDASETRQLPPDALQAYLDQGDALLARWLQHAGEGADDYDAGGERRTRWVITAESITQEIADYGREVDAFLGGSAGSFKKRFVILAVGSVLLLGGVAVAATYIGKNR